MPKQDNLRILANFGKFSRKNSKIYFGFRPYVFEKYKKFRYSNIFTFLSVIRQNFFVFFNQIRLYILH